MINIKQEANDNNVAFSIKKDIYPLSMIMKTAYGFTEKFYIYLDQPDDNNIEVHLKAKSFTNKDAMESIVGEFFNELLNQSLRVDIYNKTKELRQLILGRALYLECIEVPEGSICSENAEIEELNLSVDDCEDYKQDQLGIASNWCDSMKYSGGKDV